MINSFSDKKPVSTLVAILSLSFVLLLCFSCGSLPKNTLPEDAGSRPVSWFESDSDHYLFNTSIDFMKNHLSGLTVVKPLSSGNYRVVILTETGLKIMDMEFFADSEPRIHYIMEQLNRKIMIRTLQKDMNLMLMNHVENMNPFWYSNYPVNPGMNALYKVNSERYFYTIDKGQIHPSVAMMGKGRKFKSVVHFFGTNVSGIDSLKLQHNNIDLSIGLFRIHELQ